VAVVPVGAHTGGFSRDGLIAAILEFVGDQDLLTRQDIRAALEREIDGAGPDGLLALKARLSSDTGWDYYPPDPLARRVHHLLAARFLHSSSEVANADHLAGLTDRPVTIFANHLSYADANVVEVLLHRWGGAALANRLTAIAGPKVFTTRERRFSSLCFGTIKVPQSTGVSSGDAVSSAREVAQGARRSIEVAHARLGAGDALLLFGEGTRSRTSAMQSMLPGVARYLDVPGTWILPVGLAGPEALFAVEDSTLRPARVVMRLARSFRADDLLKRAAGDRRVAMDAIGLSIAPLTPPAYRGVYADPDRFPQARDVLEDLGC